MSNGARRRTVLAGVMVVPLALAVAAGVGSDAAAQQQAQGQGARMSAREAAPIDLTGYWVSVVSEDWHNRMVTPQKGDYESLPLNDEGRRVADGWDLAADNAAGLQCKPYGVGNIMRQPGRLHITWQDDETLKIEFDAGTQTRLLHFGEVQPAGGEPTWQGRSVAVWEMPARGRENFAGLGDLGRAGPRWVPTGGSLRVSTANFRAGYLRTNGVPYSETATITEYFDIVPPLPNGDQWLVVGTTVEDPQYLREPFLTSTNFKKEPDGSRWNPTPCRTDAPGPVESR